MNKIIVSQEKLHTNLPEIVKWLVENAGVGCERYGGEKNVTHWLSGDDWLYYNQVSVGAPDENGIEQISDPVTVFIFRTESVAFEFALRFL